MDQDVLRSLWISWVGAGVRVLILLAGAWLKTTGHIPVEFIDAIVNKASAQSPQFSGDLFIVAVAAWTTAQKWLAHRKLQAQKDVPAGTPIKVAGEVAAGMRAS